jgi:cell division protein FtsQ
VNALLRIVAWTLAVALVALPVVAVVQGWIGAERWPLRTLRIHGNLERVDAQALRAAVLPHAQRGFFAVRLADARAAVARLPWVERADVRKRWPDVLEVHVVEHRPFARWGDDRLLSERGLLFPRGSLRVPERLPRFDAPDTRVADVVALYNEARVLFAGSGADPGPGSGQAVRAVALDRRGSWSLRLSNGTAVIVGRDDARPRLKRFARLLPQLLAQEPTRALVRADLRYTNGFALTWRELPGAGSREPGTGQRIPASFSATGYRLPATRVSNT